jgi:hypothetical protein
MFCRVELAVALAVKARDLADRPQLAAVSWPEDLIRSMNVLISSACRVEPTTAGGTTSSPAVLSPGAISAGSSSRIPSGASR